MRVGLVYLKPRQVAYVRRTGPYQRSSIEAWMVMFDWLERHGLRQQITAGYGLAQDNPGSVSPHQCRYDACCELPGDFPAAKSAALSVQTLPGGAFARMRHVGPYRNARSAITLLRDGWLSGQQNLNLDPARPMLIIYLDDPKLRDEAFLKCDVCMPVRVGAQDNAAVA